MSSSSRADWDIEDGFDLDGFLAQPLVVHVAAAGPTIRPFWYLWEDDAFWCVVGDEARFPKIVERDPAVAVVVDTCDLETGETLQVIATGRAEVRPFDADRVRRTFERYLGPDVERWDPELRPDGRSRIVRIAPERLKARDVSYRPSS